MPWVDEELMDLVHTISVAYAENTPYNNHNSNVIRLES